MINLLFLCIENSNRSQIAEAFGHMTGREKLKIYSAGSRPALQVNTRTVEFMKELNYDMGKHTPKSVEEFHSVEFDYIISMGCGVTCPFVPAKNYEDWQIPDPKNMSDADFRIVRDFIGIKVQELINRIFQQ